MTDTTPTDRVPRTYMIPGGGGIEEHPLGLLYHRDEVDPIIDDLAVERDAAVVRAEAAEMAVGARDALLAGCREDRASLEAEVERLREALGMAVEAIDELGGCKDPTCTYEHCLPTKVRAALGEGGE